MHEFRLQVIKGDSVLLAAHIQSVELVGPMHDLVRSITSYGCCRGFLTESRHTSTCVHVSRALLINVAR